MSGRLVCAEQRVRYAPPALYAVRVQLPNGLRTGRKVASIELPTFDRMPCTMRTSLILSRSLSYFSVLSHSPTRNFFDRRFRAPQLRVIEGLSTIVWGER